MPRLTDIQRDEIIDRIELEITFQRERENMQRLAENDCLGFLSRT